MQQDFCHPVDLQAVETEWAACVAADTVALCSNIMNCNWSNGQELIPAGDFCAPMELTMDVALLEKCVKSSSATDCNEGCQW
jgi:hypothetical protein